MSEKSITNYKMVSLSPHLLLVEFEQESLHLRKLFRKHLVLQVNWSNVEYHDEYASIVKMYFTDLWILPHSSAQYLKRCENFH